jgi:S-adenosylmethionine/arginine decarboxylase-like enzyme
MFKFLKSLFTGAESTVETDTIPDNVWGLDYAFDCGGCDVTAITDAATIKAFTKELVKEIDMVAYGRPLLKHFAAHDPSKGGYTLVQLIETSNIAVHFVDSNGTLYGNVFSCKAFDPAIVDEVVTKYFKAKKIRGTLTYRFVEA